MSLYVTAVADAIIEGRKLEEQGGVTAEDFVAEAEATENEETSTDDATSDDDSSDE